MRVVPKGTKKCGLGTDFEEEQSTSGQLQVSNWTGVDAKCA